MRVAYFVNLYPAVSHTFIRREIRALEALGVSVSRYALRRQMDLADDDDKAEVKKTRYILESSPGEMLKCCILGILRRPFSFVSMVSRAVTLGRRSEVGVFWHLAYALEAVILADWCSRSGIDHIHAHFGTNPATVALLTRELSGIPFSFTAHGPDEFEKAPLLSLDKKLEFAKFVVCVSSFGRSQYMRWSPSALWHKIALVHCGLDSSFFQTKVAGPPGTPRLVCIGRLDDRKAQILLVAAARRLRDQGVRFHIVLVGDGPMRPHIEKAIKESALEETITLTGWLSGASVKAEIAAARALVLPSFSENMPVVIMEAFALGRPVLSTYIAGIPEMVESGKTGWLVPAGDEIALARAMQEVLAAPVDQLASMAAAGRLYFANEHNVLVEAAKLKCLFESAAATVTSSNRISERAGQRATTVEEPVISS